jgi:hypothetical protein
LKSEIKPGALAWIQDEELPKDYGFIGVVLEIPKWREDDYEHMCFKLLSDGEVFYVEPELVTLYEEVR